jgi:hypothetical protein
MPGDRPKPLDRLTDALAVLGRVAVGVLGIIAVVLLSTRLRFVAMMLVIVPIGVVTLIVSSALWGGLLYTVGTLLGLPGGPNEGRSAGDGVGQVMAVLLFFGPPLVVTGIATLWLLRHLSRFVDRVTSDL